MDRLTKKQRSECMSHIRGKNTGLEKIFRKSVRSLGIKGYRLYAKVPGRPDLYFPKQRLSVFIDGCFWHGCPRCDSFPVTNLRFWKEKIERNRMRDKTVGMELRKAHIRILRFWGHEIKKNSERCAKKLFRLLQATAAEKFHKPKSAKI